MIGQATKQSVLTQPSGGILTAIQSAFGGKLMLVAAFMSVYLFWGSTFLAIHYAIDTVPPFLMAGARFLVAGAILYAWARLRGASRPQPIHLRTALITGGLMMLGGSAIVGWAQQYLSSGMASLLVATVPLWAVVIDAISRRQRPSLAVSAGLVLGLAGIGLLVGPESFSGDKSVPLAMLVLLAACLSWSIGTHYSRQAAQPESASMSNGLNLLAGGVMLVAFSGINGEFGHFHLSEVNVNSILALAYLVIFGSIVGFSAYMWLVKTTTPARASSNFYVNPMVGVFLGWLVLGETVSDMTFVAAAVIIAAVALIVTQKKHGPKVVAGEPAAEESAATSAVAAQPVAGAATPESESIAGEIEPALTSDDAPAEPVKEEPCWQPLC